MRFTISKLSKYWTLLQMEQSNDAVSVLLRLLQPRLSGMLSAVLLGALGGRIFGQGVNMSAIPIGLAQPQASPFRLFQAINGFHLTEAIRGAIELDIFTAIGAGHTTAEALSRRCSVAERGARILCDFLVVNGFLSKTGDQYSLAEDSAMFLDRSSPSYMGSCTEFLLSDHLRENFRDLTNAVRLGGCEQNYALDPESPIWVAFARSMAPMMTLASEGLAQIVLSHEMWRRFFQRDRLFRGPNRHHR